MAGIVLLIVVLPPTRWTTYLCVVRRKTSTFHDTRHLRNPMFSFFRSGVKMTLMSSETTTPPENNTFVRHPPMRHWVSWSDGSGGTWTYILMMTTTVGGDTFCHQKMLGREAVSHAGVVEMTYQELEDALREATARAQHAA